MMRSEVRQAIHEFTPPAPAEINPKIHPALSEVIMKALAKAPEERYQSGQELVNDLERCKESAPKKDAKKSAAPGQGIECAAGGETRGIRGRASAKEIRCRCAVASIAAGKLEPPQAKAAAAAAGWESASHSPPNHPSHRRGSGVTESCRAKALCRSEPARWPKPKKLEVPSPAHGVDPAMAAEAAKENGRGPSFSEISELPPLKEIYTPPPPPPAARPKPNQARNSGAPKLSRKSRRCSRAKWPARRYRKSRRLRPSFSRIRLPRLWE